MIVEYETKLDAWMREGERKQRRWALAGTIAVVVAALIAIAIWWAIAANLVEVSDARALQAIESSGFRDVKLGESFGNAVAVAEGLKQGERVIITGGTMVNDGDQVKVIP